MRFHAVVSKDFFFNFMFHLPGGDIDAASKTLVGVCRTNRGFHFLIVVRPI